MLGEVLIDIDDKISYIENKIKMTEYILKKVEDNTKYLSIEYNPKKNIYEYCEEYNMNYLYNIRYGRLHYNCNEFLYKTIFVGNAIFVSPVENDNGIITCRESNIIKNPIMLDLLRFTDKYFKDLEEGQIYFEGANILHPMSYIIYNIVPKKNVVYIEALIND
jgi:hypothetical protein